MQSSTPPLHVRGKSHRCSKPPVEGLRERRTRNTREEKHEYGIGRYGLMLKIIEELKIPYVVVHSD